jgi:hypothetical protein
VRVRATLVTFSLVALVSVVLAIGELPPLPEGEGKTTVLLPDTPLAGEVGGSTASQRFLLLAREGETLTLTLRRAKGNFIPYLRLLDSNGAVLAEQSATDLAGREAEITLKVT